MSFSNFNEKYENDSKIWENIFEICTLSEVKSLLKIVEYFMK